MAAIFSHRCLGRCRCLPASGGIFVDPSSSSRSLSRSLSMSLICAPEQAGKDEIRRRSGRRSKTTMAKSTRIETKIGTTNAFQARPTSVKCMSMLRDLLRTYVVAAIVIVPISFRLIPEKGHNDAIYPILCASQCPYQFLLCLSKALINSKIRIP